MVAGCGKAGSSNSIRDVVLQDCLVDLVHCMLACSSVYNMQSALYTEQHASITSVAGRW